MSRFDLADAVPLAGPPSAHLLKPAAVLLVLAPLIASVGLHRVWSDAVQRLAESEQQIASLDERAAASAISQQRIDRHRLVLDGAAALHHATSASLALVPDLTAHLQPGTHLTEFFVDATGVRIAGSAPAAGDVSLWLSRSAQRDDTLKWAAPEIHGSAGGDGRIAFSQRIGRAMPSRGSPQS